MTLFVLCLAIVVCIAASAISYHNGKNKGRNEGALARAKYLQAQIDGALKGVTNLSIESFAEHCHTTVTSDLYGTPDWLTHICFKKFGEAGELAEHIGKASRDDGWSIFHGTDKLTPERRELILKEIGDGWWYDIMIIHELKSSPREVMLLNIKKREGRKQRGTLKGSGDNR